jgi:hypothetical protein
MRVSSFGPIRQIAYVVGDLEASMRHWLRFSGIGPWTCFRNVMLPGRYRGCDRLVRMHVALGYDERETEIELIEVVSDAPSPYQGGDGRPLLGLHHLAWFSDDIDRDIAVASQRGMRPCFEAGNAVTRVAYLESPDQPNLLFELIEMNDVMRAGLEARLEAARRWNGAEPIQVIDLGE